MYISGNNMHGSCLCTITTLSCISYGYVKTTFSLVHKQFYSLFFKQLSCHVSLLSKYLALWNKTKSLDILYTHNCKNFMNLASHPKVERFILKCLPYITVIIVSSLLENILSSTNLGHCYVRVISNWYYGSNFDTMI